MKKLDTSVSKNSEMSHSRFPMFCVRLKCGLECWPNLSSETGHQTESRGKKRKKVSTEGKKRRQKARRLAFETTCWLDGWLTCWFVTLFTSFYTAASLFALLHYYYITHWHRFSLNVAVGFWAVQLFVEQCRMFWPVFCGQPLLQ